VEADESASAPRTPRRAGASNHEYSERISDNSD